eukprot:3484305-Pleurochrysis_carterae.AAC.1
MASLPVAKSSAERRSSAPFMSVGVSDSVVALGSANEAPGVFCPIKMVCSTPPGLPTYAYQTRSRRLTLSRCIREASRCVLVLDEWAHLLMPTRSVRTCKSSLAARARAPAEKLGGGVRRVAGEVYEEGRDRP